MPGEHYTPGADCAQEIAVITFLHLVVFLTALSGSAFVLTYVLLLNRNVNCCREFHVLLKSMLFSI